VYLSEASNVTRDDKRYIDILQKSYKFKKPETNNKEVKKLINKFSLRTTGLDAFAKFREFKLFSIKHGINENDEAVKKLTSLAEASDKYTKKLKSLFDNSFNENILLASVLICSDNSPPKSLSPHL
jgi:hypothetical protein